MYKSQRDRVPCWFGTNFFLLPSEIHENGVAIEKNIQKIKAASDDLEIGTYVVAYIRAYVPSAVSPRGLTDYKYISDR